MRQRGYTLVEVLTVLAILAVLSALLWPVFTGVREKGRLSICQSNLRQIGVVIQQYVQDNDGTYPSTFYIYGSGPHQNDGLPSQLKGRELLWCATGLQPYRNTFTLAQCTNGNFPWPAPPEAGQCSVFYTNYFYNTSLLDELPLREHGSGVKETKVINSAGIIVMGDMANYWFRHVSWPQNAKEVNSPLSNYEPRATHHSDGANYLFADGHIKWLTPETASQTQQRAVLDIAAP